MVSLRLKEFRVSYYQYEFILIKNRCSFLADLPIYHQERWLCGSSIDGIERSIVRLAPGCWRDRDGVVRGDEDEVVLLLILARARCIVSSLRRAELTIMSRSSAGKSSRLGVAFFLAPTPLSSIFSRVCRSSFDERSIFAVNIF